MHDRQDEPSNDFEVNDTVRVTEPFEGHDGEIVEEPVGESGKIDVELDDGRYLVLFPGARGWFIPPDALEPSDEWVRLQ